MKKCVPECRGFRTADKEMYELYQVNTETPRQGTHVTLRVFQSYLKLLFQSYLTLCDPVDCSPPGSSVHGILQVRILEWVTISFSPRVSS